MYNFNINIHCVDCCKEKYMLCEYVLCSVDSDVCSMLAESCVVNV